MLSAAGPLDGDQCVARARVDRHGIASRLDVLGNVSVVGRDVRGVHHQQEMFFPEPVDE